MSKSGKSDLQKLKEGDKALFRQYFHRYHQRLYCFAIQYLKSRELSEEVVQEAFIKLWTHRKKVNESIPGFLFTTTKNLTFNLIQKNKQRMLNQLRFEHYMNQLSVEEVKDQHARKKMLLQKAVECLPDGKKKVFKMKAEQGLTNEEIADVLGVTMNTVKSQFYQASKLIKNYIEEQKQIRVG